MDSRSVGCRAQAQINLTEKTNCSFEEGSGDDPESLLIPEASNEYLLFNGCIPLTIENLENYVYSGCYPFMTRRCFLLNYTLDYQHQDQNLEQLNTLLEVTDESVISAECKDVIRTFTCAYVYPGCNPVNGLPEGLCEDQCIDYIFNGGCSESFIYVVTLALEADDEQVFPIRTFECDNPLQFVLTRDSSFINSSYDIDNCIKLSDYVNNPLPLNDTATTTTITNGLSNTLTLRLTLLISSISVLLVALVIVVTLLMVCVCLIKRRKKKRIARISRMNDERLSLNTYIVPNRLQATDQERYYDDTACYHLTSDDLEMLSEDLRNALIPFEMVKITGDLGEGAFGMVFKGQLTKNGKNIDVAIKTVKNCALTEMKGFLKESSIMCSFSHPNVLGMEGICLDPESQSPYLVLPFMKNGDLRSYLKNKRNNSQKSSDDFYAEDLTHETLLGMCYQISCGMEYLASRKLVHRDLAARNCMIDEFLCVKVADFGLTRDIYEHEYYRQSSNSRIPVKWMSPESLSDRISNEKTDVWSFGVTCWEIFSLGRTPYPTLANQDILEYLEQGLRLKKPVLCNENFYDIMMLCWKYNSESRPSFEKLTELISKLLPTEDMEYLKPGCHGNNDSYVVMENPITTQRRGSKRSTFMYFSYETPPNTPFFLSECSGEYSPHNGSALFSPQSCQIEDEFVSNSEDSDDDKVHTVCSSDRCYDGAVVMTHRLSHNMSRVREDSSTLHPPSKITNLDRSTRIKAQCDQRDSTETVLSTESITLRTPSPKLKPNRSHSTIKKRTINRNGSREIDGYIFMKSAASLSQSTLSSQNK